MKKEQTILIVDDEEMSVRLLKAMLVQENYQIVAAYSGEDALRILNDRNFDLILLDVMMPGMDGFKVCRKIKKEGKGGIIPILMVTVLTDREDRVKAMKAGADDFLSKPVEKTELLERVKSLLAVNN
jgi:putative two-component system response regulator